MFWSWVKIFWSWIKNHLLKIRDKLSALEEEEKPLENIYTLYTSGTEAHNKVINVFANWEYSNYNEKSTDTY